MIVVQDRLDSWPNLLGFNTYVHSLNSTVHTAVIEFPISVLKRENVLCAKRIWYLRSFKNSKIIKTDGITRKNWHLNKDVFLHYM